MEERLAVSERNPCRSATPGVAQFESLRLFLDGEDATTTGPTFSGSGHSSFSWRRFFQAPCI
jgi:hypothetical protein